MSLHPARPLAQPPYRRDEVRVHPVDLASAADLTLHESTSLFEALQLARGDLPLAASAIGDAPAADFVALAHTGVVEAAGTAFERLVAVLEHDVEALYRTAFGYQQADDASAEALDFGAWFLADTPEV
jgi:hypothetical protein